MLSCSTLVIIRKHQEYAVGGLIGVVITQALGYGLIFDLNFFLRNLSVMGGLIMVLSDSWVRKTKAFAGLPQLEEKDRKMYFQLAGRVLLIFLFVGFVFSGEWTIGRIIVSLLGFVACVMVVVGFKAKLSATLLVAILSIFNISVNNFWTVCSESSLCHCFQNVLTDVYLHSFMSTTPTRTLPSMTSSRFFPSLGVFCCSSTAVQASSASTKRKRSTKVDPPNEFGIVIASVLRGSHLNTSLAWASVVGKRRGGNRSRYIYWTGDWSWTLPTTRSFVARGGR